MPTVVTDSGAFVGSKAFEWLSQFSAQTELDHYAVHGPRGLAWAAVESELDNFVQFSQGFSDFEPPTD